MGKKKRQRVAPSPPRQTSGREATPWHKKTWPWVTGLAVVVSWVLLNGIAALSNAEKLPTAVSRFYNKVSAWYHIDQDWTGKWTNEGEIDARYQQEIFVDLDLLVWDRGVGGTIGSWPQRDAIPYDYVLLEGSVSGDKLDVLAYDYFQGAPKRIAKFEITRVDSEASDQIKLVTTWQAQPWFPEEAILWRLGETDMLPEQPLDEG